MMAEMIVPAIAEARAENEDPCGGDVGRREANPMSALSRAGRAGWKRNSAALLPLTVALLLGAGAGFTLGWYSLLLRLRLAQHALLRLLLVGLDGGREAASRHGR